jgi:hypothetical protein
MENHRGYTLSSLAYQLEKIIHSLTWILPTVEKIFIHLAAL